MKNSQQNLHRKFIRHPGLFWLCPDPSFSVCFPIFGSQLAIFLCPSSFSQTEILSFPMVNTTPLQLWNLLWGFTFFPFFGDKRPDRLTFPVADAIIA